MEFDELELGEDSGGVMPLVLCRSRGGPYDDGAFSSGWRLGAIGATLAGPGISALCESIRAHGASRQISWQWPTATP